MRSSTGCSPGCARRGSRGIRRSRGLSGSLRATLMYLRQNIVRAVIGEFLGVSQPTVSRAIKALTAAIARTLVVLLLTAEEVPEGCDFRGGRHPLPLPGLAQAPRSVVGQAQERGDERPGSWSCPAGTWSRIPTRAPCTTWPPWTPRGCWRESMLFAFEGVVGRTYRILRRLPSGGP